jgi:hypothetical protein
MGQSFGIITLGHDRPIDADRSPGAWGADIN